LNSGEGKGQAIFRLGTTIAKEPGRKYKKRNGSYGRFDLLQYQPKLVSVDK